MNATVALGESVNFTCTATAQPLPIISWWRVDNINGTRTQINTTISSYNVLEVVIDERQVVSTLTILEAELSNAGGYVCIAELLALFPSVEESAILTVGEIVVFFVVVIFQVSLVIFSYTPSFRVCSSILPHSKLYCGG